MPVPSATAVPGPGFHSESNEPGQTVSLMARRRQPQMPARQHNGQVAVLRSNQRWCSDGFEFRCDDGSPLRATFALACCDCEAMS